MLPATSAPAVGPAASAIGKLNGLITPQTPYGRITLRVRLVRRDGVHRLVEAVVALHLVGVVAEEDRGLLDVAERLEAVLADLHAHQRGELVGAVADQVAGLAHDRDAVLPRGGCPGLGGCLGGGDGVVDVRRGRRVDGGEQDRGVDGAVHLEGADRSCAPRRSRRSGACCRTTIARSRDPARRPRAGPRCPR